MTELRLQRNLLEWREVEGEVIALEHERSVYIAANRSGTLLWRALNEGATESRLAELLAQEYGLDAERARADVAAFLADLSARGLIEAT
jgi:Coenzyme PQQ synthesis protein D (PqqD)